MCITVVSEVLAECRYCRYIYLSMFSVRRRRRRGTRTLSSRWWRMSPSHVWSFNYLGGLVLTLLLLTRVNFMAFWLRFLTYNMVVLCFDGPLWTLISFVIFHKQTKLHNQDGSPSPGCFQENVIPSVWNWILLILSPPPPPAAAGNLRLYSLQAGDVDTKQFQPTFVTQTSE